MRDFSSKQPFTRAQALNAGLDLTTLRRPRYRTLFRGIYVSADIPDSPALIAQALLLLVGPAGFVSHTSAARVYGVPLPTAPGEHVSVTDPRDRRRRQGVTTHVCPKPHLRLMGGLAISAPEQLFVELAATLPLVDLVVAGDHLVRRGFTSPERLRAFCQGRSRSSIEAASYVRDRVDSPMETRVRMLIVLAGIPEPDVNVTIRDEFGEPLRRYDLSWPSVRVIVEYDGRHHIERQSQWEADLGRREDVDSSGWRILVVTARGIYVEPERTLNRVWQTLHSAGLNGLPRRLRDDWRPHFPSRRAA